MSPHIAPLQMNGSLEISIGENWRRCLCHIDSDKSFPKLLNNYSNECTTKKHPFPLLSRSLSISQSHRNRANNQRITPIQIQLQTTSFLFSINPRRRSRSQKRSGFRDYDHTATTAARERWSMSSRVGCRLVALFSWWLVLRWLWRDARTINTR